MLNVIFVGLFFFLKLVKHLTQSGTEKETAFIRCESQEPLTSAGLELG